MTFVRFILADRVAEFGLGPKRRRGRRLEREFVPEDATFAGMRRAQWFLPDLSYFRRQACCRRPE